MAGNRGRKEHDGGGESVRLMSTWYPERIQSHKICLAEMLGGLEKVDHD